MQNSSPQQEWVSGARSKMVFSQYDQTMRTAELSTRFGLFGVENSKLEEFLLWIYLSTRREATTTKGIES